MNAKFLLFMVCVLDKLWFWNRNRIYSSDLFSSIYCIQCVK